MSRGGARARSGPAPDPNALRRDRTGDKTTWTTLPAEGRKGRAPAWPLSKQTAREKTLWSAEWKRPQAVQWARNSQHLEVALYVRTVITAEKPDASTNARTLVLRQQEALGISLPGLARNRWRIEEPAQPEARPQGRTASSAKSRFKVLDGGAR